MVAVFKDSDEIIVVGLNPDGSPMDSTGTLFGSKSGRDIETFERFDIDTDGGQGLHINLTTDFSEVWDS